MAPFSRTKVLETILALAGVAVLIKILTKAEGNLLLWVCLALVFIGLLSPKWSTGIALVWDKFSKTVGGVVSKIILGLVWLLVLVPIAFVSRPFRKRKMIIPPEGNSYFVTREKTFTPDDLKHPW